MSCELIAMLEARINQLEKRVEHLENKSIYDRTRATADKAQALVNCYGEYVTKAKAAQILGVTRATIYAMLADGRIMGAAGGGRVGVRSIAYYMGTPHKKGRGPRKDILPSSTLIYPKEAEHVD